MHSIGFTDERLIGTISVAVGFCIITFLHIVLGACTEIVGDTADRGHGFDSVAAALVLPHFSAGDLGPECFR